MDGPHDRRTFYPATPAFQHTAQVPHTATVTYSLKKEHFLRFAISVLMSLGFFGVLLATQELTRLVYEWSEMEFDSFQILSRAIHATANLFGGFVAGGLATVVRTRRPIRYPFVVVALVVAYAFYLSTFRWIPELDVFALYSLPYLGAALVGASLPFRPWSLVSRRQSLNGDPLGARGEEFLFGIDRDDVRAESADAPVWTKGDLRH